MKRPAYARALVDGMAQGQRVDLVVIAVHDWSAGRLLPDRPFVARVVVPEDQALDALDLAFVFGANVLVMGGEDAAFYGVIRLALASGAASVWAEFDNGLWRVVPFVGHPGVLALDQVEDADALLVQLPWRQLAALLSGDGVYQAPVFREARLSAFGEVFGHNIEARLREKVAA